MTSSYNLVAVDLYGHGHTAGLQDVVDYWVCLLAHEIPISSLAQSTDPESCRGVQQDHAKIVNEVIHGLGLKSAYILGTSQGGFIAARCALLEPALVRYLDITNFCVSTLRAENRPADHNPTLTFAQS